MKQYSQAELETRLQAIRNLINQYQEWAENSYIQKDTKTDIYRAGLKEVGDEIYYLMGD